MPRSSSVKTLDVNGEYSSISSLLKQLVNEVVKALRSHLEVFKGAMDRLEFGEIDKMMVTAYTLREVVKALDKIIKEFADRHGLSKYLDIYYQLTRVDTITCYHT